MVRRRTRACATSKAPVDLMANGGGGGSAVVLANAAQLLEDQYFASPKRKDCKVEDSTYDEGAHSSGGSSPTTIQNEDAVALRAKLKSTSPNKLKGGINGRAIGKCRLSIYVGYYFFFFAFKENCLYFITTLLHVHTRTQAPIVTQYTTSLPPSSPPSFAIRLNGCYSCSWVVSNLNLFFVLTLSSLYFHFPKHSRKYFFRGGRPNEAIANKIIL